MSTLVYLGSFPSALLAESDVQAHVMILNGVFVQVNQRQHAESCHLPAGDRHAWRSCAAGERRRIWDGRGNADGHCHAAGAMGRGRGQGQGRAKAASSCSASWLRLRLIVTCCD